MRLFLLLLAAAFTVNTARVVAQTTVADPPPVEKAASQLREVELMCGPQLPETANKQVEIDALLASSD